MIKPEKFLEFPRKIPKKTLKISRQASLGGWEGGPALPDRGDFLYCIVIRFNKMNKKYIITSCHKL